MAAALPNDEKKKLVVALLVPNSQKGMHPREIQDEFLDQIGQPLMPTLQETKDYLKSLVAIGDVREINGLYFANSENSQHVIELVEHENQNNKKRNNFNGSFQGRFQPYARAVVNRRKSICYDEPYIDVSKPCQIQKRRLTMGQFRPETPPRSRSRSNSPKKNDTFRRSHINNNEKHSHSPDLRSKRPCNRLPESPPAKRSRWSPIRDRRQSRPRSRSRSPRGDSRPSRWKRNSPIYERTKTEYKSRQSEPVVRPMQENTPPVRPVQAVTPQDPSQRETINERLSSAVAEPSNNVRHFKFNLIGDGLLYHVIHGLDASITLNPYLISRELLLKTAIESVNSIITSKVNKKKCVILSIGTSDLQNGTSLCEMRKQFLTLYRLCQNNGLKPLVTTISCMDTMELIEKAKVFNEFLKQNFNNVIDLFKAVNGANGGLANSLASLRKSPKSSQNRATLSIGMHSRLVLRVEN